MTSASFPLDEYHARIGVSAGAGPTVERLEELQSAQLCSIPYENFDILLGRGINLSPDHLIDKLVRSPRGGYCFELNGLFLAALEAEGFEARRYLGRVHVTGEPTGRGHQLALVTISGREWLVDVGSARYSPRIPMPFEHDVETLHDGQPFRLVAHELGHMVQLQDKEDWIDVYSFDLAPVIDADIAFGNHFTSTHPSSVFMSNRIAVLFHPDGETVIFNDTCAVRRDGETINQEMPDDETYLDILKDRLGIELDADYADLAPLTAV